MLEAYSIITLRVFITSHNKITTTQQWKEIRRFSTSSNLNISAS